MGPADRQNTKIIIEYTQREVKYPKDVLISRRFVCLRWKGPTYAMIH